MSADVNNVRKRLEKAVKAMADFSAVLDNNLEHGGGSWAGPLAGQLTTAQRDAIAIVDLLEDGLRKAFAAYEWDYDGWGEEP